MESVPAFKSTFKELRAEASTVKRLLLPTTWGILARLDVFTRRCPCFGVRQGQSAAPEAADARREREGKKRYSATATSVSLGLIFSVILAYKMDYAKGYSSDYQREIPGMGPVDAMLTLFASVGHALESPCSLPRSDGHADTTRSNGRLEYVEQAATQIATPWTRRNHQRFLTAGYRGTPAKDSIS